MAVARVTFEARPVNLADCTKGDPQCVEARGCAGPPLPTACSAFDVPQRLRATVNSSCGCLDGTYDLFYCSGAWRTINPQNHTIGTDCAAAGWDGPAPVACGTDLWIEFVCAFAGGSWVWQVQLELGNTEMIGVLHCIPRHGDNPTVSGPPLLAVVTYTTTHVPAGCPGGFACTDPISITITITE